MKYYTKIFLATILIILSLSMSVSIVNAKNDIALSATEEVELLGIDIPIEILSLNNSETILNQLLQMAKEGARPVYNYQLMQLLYNDIYNAINNTYSNIGTHVYSTQVYTLVDSTLATTWNNSFLSYNCYAYAIDRPADGFINPGYKSGRPFSMEMTISAMADSVIADLTVIGFSAYKTTIKPTVFTGAQIIIAIRKGTVDFHFMKGIEPNIWKHKPGNTLPLKWKYTTPNYKIWTNEAYFIDTSYAPTTTYNSTVYYIVGFLQIKTPSWN